MKTLSLRCEYDPALEQIELLIRAPGPSEELTALLEKLNSTPSYTLTVTDENSALRRIAADELISVSVNGKLVQLVTENGSFTVRQPLQSLESALDGRKFVRISRYEIVNLDKVIKFDFTLGGTLRLELAGGIETWASRRCIPAIRRRLSGKE